MRDALFSVFVLNDGGPDDAGVMVQISQCQMCYIYDHKH